MDQLKTFLAIAKKYQFWVLCGLMLLTSVGCWFWATGDLANLFQKRKAAIKKDFTDVQQIRQGHPNEKVIEYVRGRTDKLKQGVFTAWETLYKQQKANNPFPAKDLGDDFKIDFERLQPKGELLNKFRERYRTFIPNYLNNLKIEIDARRPAEDAKDTKPGTANATALGKRAPIGMEGREPGASTAPEWIGTVDWNPGDYDRLVRRFEWQQPPTTLAVVLAQEDLWVYEALLRVIRSVNETGSAVKRIEAIDIGKDAAISWRTAADTVVRTGQGAGPGAGPLGGFSEGRPGGPGGEQGDPNRLLIENRYIDDKGQPVPPIADYPFAQHPYSEFKMMPIRLSLVMDQRRLPNLLAECANSSMPIEVRRVRLCKTQSTPLELTAPGSPTPGGHVGEAGRPGMMNEFARRSASPEQGGGGGQSQELVPDDVPIEIYGVIYIFNPPEREKFGVGTASAKNPAEPAPGLPPGAQPGSPQPPPKNKP